jgi:hypothetical protein
VSRIQHPCIYRNHVVSASVQEYTHTRQTDTNAVLSTVKNDNFRSHETLHLYQNGLAAGPCSRHAAAIWILAGCTQTRARVPCCRNVVPTTDGGFLCAGFPRLKYSLGSVHFCLHLQYQSDCDHKLMFRLPPKNTYLVTESGERVGDVLKLIYQELPFTAFLLGVSATVLCKHCGSSGPTGSRCMRVVWVIACLTREDS